MTGPIQDAYPLAPGQGGILFQSLSGTSPGAYIIQIVMDLQGTIDPVRETTAWDALVARHDPLRTAFVWKGQAQPLQVVGRTARLCLSRVDLSQQDPETQNAQLADFLVTDRADGFDLARAPLLRVCRFDLGRDQHRMVVTFHHAILDGWSIPLLLRDWIALYAGTTLPEPRAFKRHVAWVKSRDTAATQRFWQAEMSGAPGGLWSLPGPATPPVNPRGDLSVALNDTQTERLTTALRPYGVTLATAVHGLWAVLQARVLDQSDVIYGLARAGRPATQPGAAQAVGMFLNTLPLRAHVAPDALAAEWLRQLQTRLQAQAPYEHATLAEVQTASGQPGGTPLINSAVVFENYPRDPALLGSAPGLCVSAVEVLEQTSLPLALFAIHTDGLRLRLLYDADRIDTASAQSILTDLQAGLAMLGRSPQMPLEHITVTTRRASLPQATATTPSNAADPNALATIWQDLLALPSRPTGDANFFDLGGQSLLVITLRDRIRADLGQDVEIPDLFRHATLSQQAEHLHSLANDRSQTQATDATLMIRQDARSSGQNRQRQRRARTISKEYVRHD